MFSRTFDVFRDSLQALNIPLLTFYFLSPTEFFTRPAVLQVVPPSLNPLSMHWSVSLVYLYIINGVRQRMKYSAIVLMTKILELPSTYPSRFLFSFFFIRFQGCFEECPYYNRKCNFILTFYLFLMLVAFMATENKMNVTS